MKCQSCIICFDKDLCAKVNKDKLSPKEGKLDFEIKLCESNPQKLNELHNKGEING